MRRLVLAIAMTVAVAGVAHAAQCSSTGGGFEAWKPKRAAEAKAAGIKARGIAALMATKYSTGTIRADRNQHSFKLSLNAFMAKRGAAGIISRGRSLKKANAALFAKLEKRYGVPAGPLIAIWGMETGFGGFTGSQPTISAIATLAYDCRRTEFFNRQLMAALRLADRGVLSSGTRGAMHGEVGQTQFMPENIELFGADGDGGGINLNGKADALASTAKMLSGQGWNPGGPYKAGSFAIWNDSTVYRQALAIMATRIDAP